MPRPVSSCICCAAAHACSRNPKCRCSKPSALCGSRSTWPMITSTDDDFGPHAKERLGPALAKMLHEEDVALLVVDLRVEQPRPVRGGGETRVPGYVFERRHPQRPCGGKRIKRQHRSLRVAAYKVDAVVHHHPVAPVGGIQRVNEQTLFLRWQRLRKQRPLPD